ncbi:MAG TPA: ABC transporter permease [Thermoanaerobaculia bacterium]|jgi:ABC-2 type transport system permease protein|nr:ABC transporter permease [Thermoanaerobaculia bacterium]
MTEIPADSQVIQPALSRSTRPLWWTVRRELWENRSIYLAPLIVAGLILFGFLISMLAGSLQQAVRLEGAERAAKLVHPYNLASALLMGTMFFVSIFYCLDALSSERRDRSILFWKSLPVSDGLTVAAKASIPLVILPLITAVVLVLTELLMLVSSSALLLVSGRHAAVPWTALPWLEIWGVLVQHLFIVHSLWYAPLYAWLLLVSASVRRAAIVWAALPLVAIPIVEKMAFNSAHFLAVLQQHLTGGPEGAAVFYPEGVAMPHHLAGFALSPSFWIGLFVAAAFLVLTVRVRRQRGPM